MVAQTALQLNQTQSGPRPLNPMRDLGAVADLMEVAFRDELDAGGRRMIREAKALSYMGPLLYPLSLFSGGAAGLSPGFVWEEDGRVVGNVTIMTSRKVPGSWHMANVAVHPRFRRQGIATGLVKTAIEHIQRLDGKRISLQVRDDGPAVMLYQRLNYQSLGAVARWRLDNHRHISRIQTSGTPVRKARRDDWPAIWRLFSSVTPAAHGWPDPLSREDFRPSFWRDLGKLFTGESAHRWVVPRAATNGLDGYVELHTRRGASSRLTLRTQESASGWLEGDLLREALRFHQWYLPVVIDHPAGDAPAEERLREAGFRTLRVLRLMRLEMDG